MKAFIIVVILILSALSIWKNLQTPTIPPEKAQEIASMHLEGRADLARDENVRVTHEKGKYVVVFIRTFTGVEGRVRRQVEVDDKSGKVLYSSVGD